MEFKENLRIYRKKMGYSAAALAKAVGVSPSAIGNWETGIRIPKCDMLQTLSEVLGVSVDALLGKEENTTAGSIAIPILGEVAAGYPMFAEENILGYEDISSTMATQGEHFALRIHGDSMKPRMHDGDIVIVRRQSTAEDGQTAVVLVGNESATVKRIQIRDDGIMLMPTNPEYSPFFYSANAVRLMPVTVLGVVVELRAKYV